jgi:hypothetical protein
MDKLAELLLDAGVTTKAQVEAAQQKQRMFGGSLALNLLVEGVVSERVVQVFLEQLLGNPGGQSYESEPDPDALCLLDRDRAARLRTIPLRVVDDTLHVLTVDPQDKEALMEVERRTEMKVAPSLVNELRFLWLLDRWYGIECSQRAQKAARRLFGSERSFASVLDSEDEDSLIYDPLAGAAPGLPGLDNLAETVAENESYLEADEEVIPILEEELPLLVVESPEEEKEALAREEESRDKPVGHGLEPLSPDGFDEALEGVETLDEVFTIFQRFGSPFFKSLSAFKVQGGMVMGWRSAGEGVEAERTRGIVVPMSGDSMLARAVGQEPHVSEKRESDLDQRVVEQMGGTEEDVFLCHSVIVLTRPVLVICGALQRAADRKEAARGFEQLCQKASSAVVRIIMKRKKAAKKKKKKKSKAKKPAGQEQTESD